MINIRPEVLEVIKKYIQEHPDQQNINVYDENYLKFMELFPKDKIIGLTLEEYCMGNPEKYPNNFCWWLEHGLTSSLGKYSAGNSNRHFIYWDKKSKSYIKNKSLDGLADEEAMREVAKLHAFIISLSPQENLELLDSDYQLSLGAKVTTQLALGNARKLRLTQLYYPEYFPNINSTRHTLYYLACLGATKEEIENCNNLPYKSAFLLKRYYEEITKLLVDIGGLSISLFSKLWYTDIFDEFLEIKVQEEKKENVDSEIVEGQNISLNQILYGPPGTGKTYATVEKAVAICDPEFLASIKDGHSFDRNRLKTRYDELIATQQISFVTFHQSFSYEDFVEGIRAKTESGQIEYSVEDGVFKKVSQLASQKMLTNVWKLSFVGQNSQKNIEKECLENNYILLRYSDNDYEDQTKDMPYRRSMESMFFNEMQNDDLVLVADGLDKIRAIGKIIGIAEPLEDSNRETYVVRRNIEWLEKFTPSIPCSDLLTQNFSHDALYKVQQELLIEEKFQKLLNYQFKHVDKKNYVLIIDEINRGNIANIFGELITLLEPSKRAENEDARSVTLPYSKESFSVPNNLYMIGTMNTSDHSLTKLDLALRRRFEFVELLPNYKLLNNIEVHNVNIGAMLKIMNDRIEILLGRDYLIGYSYFLELEGLTEDKQQEKLANIFKNKIIPLLQEYFFEDWERIQWVLNDHNKDVAEKFIHMSKDNTEIERLFGEIEGLSLVDRRYQINNDAFNQPKAYQQIINAKESE